MVVEVPTAISVPCFVALLYAVHTACTDILTGIRCHRGTKRKVRHHCKAIDTHDDNIRGDNHFTEAVGQRLYDNHRHGEDRLGNTGRQAKADNFHRILFFLFSGIWV